MKTKRLIPILVAVGITVYLGTYAFLYSIKDEQGNRFKEYVLPATYSYEFEGNVEELSFQAEDGGVLNGVLFKADSAKGVICFWKGNGGTIKEWAQMAPQFLKLHYDILITDYREQGKSKGKITIENFYSDAQLVYNALKDKYSENQIMIVGFSLGGRIAAHLAADNFPKMTILIDAASATGDFSDRFLATLYAPLPAVIGFTFQTEKDVQRSKSPVIVIGTDENARSVSYQIRPLLKEKDKFFEIKGATHGTILNHAATQHILENLLK
ncbi:alpha/beta hydrolase [Rhodocytophaga rosea]|uniref:Alpha/beta hydrolase n=1 Tax=Rhodocytophaga rosea TaxID=2704465 RepID=A0A6C0GD72_9BACT|nr:alpha/beta fold hydrolase [Rhodocytophaga rosea]QHT65949.1 alpha/beta hydrolase [Rhodocytophaga rosea]